MNITVFETLTKEFSVNDSGISYTSKKGLSRLCGITANYWGKNSFFNKDIDKYILQELGIKDEVEKSNITLTKYLINKGLVVVENKKYLIQDVIGSIVIDYYADVKQNSVARQNKRALRAIGLRTAIQEATGWNKPKREYGNLLLSAPRVWTKVFGDEFYDELSRLTGLSWDKKTHQKPCVFAQLTYELVYTHLPHSMYKQIKSTQKEHGGYIHKMHQFLNEQGLNSLVHHLELTLNILSAVSSLDQAKLLVSQAVTRNYQHSLFG